MSYPAEPPVGPIVERKDGAAKKKGIRWFFSILGPGVITGAADDDPSGIVTYTIAGAQLGTSMLWTALLSWPLMSSVQMMCARIGMVTGGGLTRALRKKFPRWVLMIVGLALFTANTINIGADLLGMADVLHLLLRGISNRVLVIVMGTIIIVATVRFRYAAIANILKWLAAVLFSYVITAFLVHPDWHQVLRATFVPSPLKSHDQWATLVAILGTTISPYLFFWQASQEIEEEKSKGHRTVASRRGASDSAIRERKLDVGLGGFFSNLIMYFIILTSAFTLHRHNITVSTSQDAVRALQPLAGDFSALLYGVGLIGVGFLAIPTLAGSAAYSFTETFGFRQGLDESLGRARAFYGILIFSILLGVCLPFTHIKPVDALFWTAVINGVLAPFLLVGILAVASDRKIMQGQPSSWLGRIMVGITAAGMFLAALGLFLL